MELTKKVTEQVRLLAKDEDEKLAETSSYDVFPPYDQAKALGKTNIDVDRIAAGYLVAMKDSFLCMPDGENWKKTCIMYEKRKCLYPQVGE